MIAPRPPRPPRPPALAGWLLHRALSADVREPFLGDLEEGFHARLANGRSADAARRWYWRETLRAPVLLPRAPLVPSPRQTPGDGPMTTLLIDLRYALRLLGRQPGFTAVIAITLALGIGATTAIFSAVYPILFSPLPFPNADRIVMVWEKERGGAKSNVGYATFEDIAAPSRTLASAAAFGDWQPVLTTRDEPERLDGSRVSADYFKTLGVMPAIGRDFTAAEDIRGNPRVAILSHGLWRRRFGGDAAIIGRTITLDDVPFTVVGVMPATFENVFDPKARLWTTLRYNQTLSWACRSCRHLHVVARVKPAVSLAEARSELDALSARMRRDHPTDYASTGFLVPTLRDELTTGVRPALLAVIGAVALVLLIACANVTNLLLARAAQRDGEFGVRAALGASNGRVVRQLVTESLLLAAVGGGLGIGVAMLGTDAIVALSPANLPRLNAIALNVPVLLFSLIATTVVGVIFGLIPALQLTRGDLHPTLLQSTRRATRRRRRTRSALVVSEMALSLVLLVGSGLLLRSMQSLFAVSPGFTTSGLLTLQVQASGARFENDTVTRAYFERVLEQVRSVPGVEQAAFTSQLPLSGDFDGYGIHLKSAPSANPEEDPSAFRYAVSPEYLETMRIPVTRGRSFTAGDRRDAPPVALVSAGFARRRWPGIDPVGQQFRIGDVNEGAWWTVVGVAGDVRQISLATEEGNAVYIPEEQWKFADGALSFVMRTRGDPTALVPALRRAIWAVDKDQPIVRVATMEHLVAETAAERRFVLVLFEAFALVALALAAAGIYGVIAGAVVERQREVGIRAALGASRTDILQMIFRQGLGMAGAGVAIGLVVSLALSKVIAGLLFGVTPFDAATYLGVAGMPVIVAAIACAIPAWRAARVDPAEVLRAE